MKHPKVVKPLYKQFIEVDTCCPWCGEEPLPPSYWEELVIPDFSDEGFKLRQNTWMDSRGRMWHLGCADIVLGEYKDDDVVTKIGEGI